MHPPLQEREEAGVSVMAVLLVPLEIDHLKNADRVHKHEYDEPYTLTVSRSIPEPKRLRSEGPDQEHNPEDREENAQAD